MSPVVLFGFVVAYFAVLLAVAQVTSRGATNAAFFSGNKNSNWLLVSFGMVGTSLSGVTFVSVPGSVGATAFTYLQIVLGQVLGYAVIAYVLMPIFYRLNLTSIYGYLEERLGVGARTTGATFFIVSRTLGATARMYLVIKVLQDIALDRLAVPFWLTAIVIIGMVLLYTYQGGVKTIVWTDMLQTLGMLTGLVVSIWFLLDALNMSLPQSMAAMDVQGLSKVFSQDADSKLFWAKQIVAGMFIAIALTGMDQEMMQKNISVKRLADSQKNVMLLALVMVGVVFLFLLLGGLLALVAPTLGVTATGDRLFAAVVFGHMPAALQMVFVLALISALFPSADGAITALTSSFCMDILRMKERTAWSEADCERVRRGVHRGVAALFFGLILVFKWINDASMVGLILKLAGYTYGPLLGLFGFGIFTRRHVTAPWVVPSVAILAPVICYGLDTYQAQLWGSYQMGLELLVVNGALVFVGLLVLSKPDALAKTYASRSTSSSR